MTQHFLTLMDFDAATLKKLITRGIELKAMQKSGEIFEPFRNRVLGMIFDKSSTRTRVSFEAGMVQLGGHAIFLSPRDTQLGRGEPVEDTARVLSRMVDAIMIRTFDHENLEKFAAYSNVPVINALTDMYHPCQLLADMQTFYEHRGDIAGKTVTYIGDGNNMCHSYMNAARQYGFNLNIAIPNGFDPAPELLAETSHCVTLFRNPEEAAVGADLITTDVWTSMGQEKEQAIRVKRFKGYQVNDTLMELANKDAIFMHCLPAHREEEVSTSVIDGSQSVVWDQAENRLHAQKALIELLLTK